MLRIYTVSHTYRISIDMQVRGISLAAASLRASCAGGRGVTRTGTSTHTRTAYSLLDEYRTVQYEYEYE